MPENFRRKSYPACGRLIILQSTGNAPIYDQNQTENWSGMASINFPAMPETIELARAADYMITTSPAFPDGIHQYRGTAPLKIPIKFKLHAFDSEYCPRGVLSLLQVAGELQSLTLPLGPKNVEQTVGPDKSANPAGSDGDVLKAADQPTRTTGAIASGIYDIFPPATCYLELIITDRTSPGIACVGYVLDANVTLHGPWLRSAGLGQNLPSMGEFSFTFVHHPGHGNAYNYGKGIYNNQTENQAFARDVRDRLYNTRDLLTHANYRGIDDV